jgi:hypothetical protein
MARKPQKAKSMDTHVVDILGNVKGRDQPVMLLNEAIKFIQHLDKKVLSADGYVFFDPFCKAGEILLASAFVRQLHKNKKKKIGQRIVHKDMFLSNRFFALAPDERHFRLSLRTFLGNEKSHNAKYTKVIRNGNYLSEADGRLNKKRFKKELQDMIDYIKTKASNKKIIAVGNPPYQENDGGFGGSASAVYNYFIEALMDNKDISEAIVVIPSRWFTTGKGTADFRDRIIKSRKIKAIRHFKNSKSVFPTVDVLGGVCFFHYDANYNGKIEFSDGKNSTKIDLSSADIILDDPRGYDLVKKVESNWNGKYTSEVAWAVRPFAIRTNYFVKNKSLPDSHKNAVPCFTKRRKILNANIKDIKNSDKVNEWQVAVPSAYAPGSKEGVRRVTLPVNQVFIIPKGYITTETYNVVASFKTKSEAENFKNYLTLDLPRYLLGLRKVTQHIYKGQWNWVPLVDAKKSWTDQKLFKLFKITKEEQEHIKSKLQEWS